MSEPRNEIKRRLLTAIFERAAEGASQALSTWLGRPVHMSVSATDEVDLAEAGDLLGPGESLVAACILGLPGPLDGQILMVFDDQAGLALSDMLLQQPPGTAREWGELEISAALETANIIGCALLNSLASHLPGLSAESGETESGALVPSPPEFRHEFAASLLEFAVMEQAMTSEKVLLARSQFRTEGQEQRWSLLFIPGANGLGLLETMLDQLSGR